MLDGKVNFERVCGIVKEWKWCELKAGLEKKIISKKVDQNRAWTLKALAGYYIF